MLYNRRDLPSAFAAAEKSLTLNKYDMLALGEYGGRLILAGNVEKGMALMQRAGEYGADPAVLALFLPLPRQLPPR